MPSLDSGSRYVHGSGASSVHVCPRSQETFHFTVRLSRLRGLAHVLVRRPSSNRRREHPTHTFVLPPRHARRGWELANREWLPTDKFIRLSPAPATPIRLTSCDLPVGQAQPAYAKIEQAESMGHHEFTNTEGYERRSNIIDLPLPTPRSSTSPWTSTVPVLQGRKPNLRTGSPRFERRTHRLRPPSDKPSARHRRLGRPRTGSPPFC